MRARRRTPLGTALALAAALVTCDGLRRDELVCEEAVAKLRSCCPGFTGDSLTCQSGPDACGRTVTPDIGEAESTSIRSASCEQLRADGRCFVSPAAPIGPAEAR